MQVNSVTKKYYEEHRLYLEKMREKNLHDQRLEHEKHLERLRVDSTQRARELGKNLGQNVDITV